MIFLVDTPKDIKSGYSYVVNREEDKFTIIEGNIKTFDNIAFDLIKRNVTDKPYDTMVLSFKEEELTLEEIQEIYYDWKEMYLGSYDEDEYYLFSVIHWDDKHPHVHVGIINRSMINEKHLRLTRYGVDNKQNGRNTAIQELINYKYNLKSPLGEKYLYQTTLEQKKRDWIVGKGKDFFEVEDDKIYENMKYEAHHANSFKEFFENMNNLYPGIELKNKYEEEVTIKIGKKKFKSLLFNKDFYDKNIEDIKAGVDRFQIENIRKKQEQYEEMFYDKNMQHKKQLEDRKINEGLLEYKLHKGEMNFLENSIDFDKEFKRIRTLKDLNLQHMRNREKVKKIIPDVSEYIFCRDDLVNLLDYAGFKLKKNAYDVARGGGYIVISKDEKDIYINSNELYDVCMTKRYDLNYNKKMNVHTVAKLKDNIKKLNLNKRADIDILKYQLANDVINLDISNSSELDELLNEVGLEKINEGHSVSKGGYITLKKKDGTKKFSIYDDIIYGMYKNNNKELTIELENDVLKSSIISNSLKDYENLKPESVYEYKLKNISEDNLRLINLTNEILDLKKDERFTRDRKSSSIIKDYNDEIIVEKTIDYDDASKLLAKKLEGKRWENVRITGSNETFQKSLLDSLSYLSSQREESRSWIDKMMIETDLSVNTININKGDIFEIEVINDMNLFEMMNNQYIHIEDEKNSFKDNKENKSVHLDKDEEKEVNIKIKEDYQEKLDNTSNKKYILRSFSI